MDVFNFRKFTIHYSVMKISFVHPRNYSIDRNSFRSGKMRDVKNILFFYTHDNYTVHMKRGGNTKSMFLVNIIFYKLQVRKTE